MVGFRQRRHRVVSGQVGGALLTARTTAADLGGGRALWYRWTDTSGFTLTEVLIGTVILSIGLLGMGTLTASIINGNARSTRTTAATVLAQEKVETIKRLGASGAANAAGTENYGTIAKYASYKRVTSVTANTPDAGLFTVTVTVFWRFDTRSLTLSTVLSP